MSLIDRIVWSIVEIGVGLIAGYGAHALTNDMFSALVWCAVAASIVGFMEGNNTQD